MRHIKYFSILILLLAVSCASVKLEAPKEPIKLDVTMRLDVYQHVQKAIDAIENIVTGVGTKQTLVVSLLDSITSTAYASEFSPVVETAALNRKARYA
ncbi:secreted protein [Candidatus Omnitrophus magneticus]|uniref:Secreted protein n=1 Tax=Candidatus Omnitrophus magneticus TaxID=1609969 RepID=A0A0F0CP55_9BACT|nr:secreted protein [Candidatus Omnitrophus magneticus]